ncbi:hypothetical protein [Listeria newyorkensis]|uniref:Uncharacterized protein n=1 Tax=Listeria newyorkensis TaxID=1497681 RepID=A0A841YY48_9LIST|nr:hypothetical protein [Listeria newyorkensis]MBC1458464.1 hypothetical protein [Listeria newyorkensis]
MKMIKGHSYSEYRSLLNHWNDAQIAERWNITHTALSLWKKENGIFITHYDVKRLKVYRKIIRLQKMGYSFEKINRLMQISPVKHRQILEDYEGVE